MNRDVEAEVEAVEAVLFLWKRKREKSTASASTQEGRMEREKKIGSAIFLGRRANRGSINIKK